MSIRKTNVLLAAIIMGAFFIFGCGIPPEQHQDVVAELNETKEKLSIAFHDIRERTKEYEAAVAELNKAKQELQQVRQETDTTGEQLSRLSSELEKAQATNKQLKAELQESRTLAASSAEELKRIKSETEAFINAEKKKAAHDLEGALEAYRAFIQKFGPSSLSAAAEARIGFIEHLIEAQKTADADQDAEDEGEL